MPVIQVLWVLRQEACHQFEASLSYRDTVLTKECFKITILQQQQQQDSSGEDRWLHV